MRHRHLYTIGHSNRGSEDFTHLLRRYGVGALVDIRAYPRSRRYPHFERPAMLQWLADAGVAYYWLGQDLGGFRKPAADSQNRALSEDGFRGFADYMTSDRFTTAVDRMLRLEPGRQLALMCAEGDPKACHRQFLADYLLMRGVQVTHILSADGSAQHVLHDRARTENCSIIYDRSTQSTLF